MATTDHRPERRFHLLYDGTEVITVAADTITDEPIRGWALRRGSKVVGQGNDPIAWWMTENPAPVGLAVELHFKDGATAAFIADDSGSVPDVSIEGMQWTHEGETVALVWHPRDHLRVWQMD